MKKVEKENIETYTKADAEDEKTVSKKVTKRKNAKNIVTEKKNEEVSLQSITIEEMLEELNNIISRMENENLSLEESLKEYERGVRLVRNCNNQMEKVEKKIIVLSGEEQLDEL